VISNQNDALQAMAILLVHILQKHSAMRDKIL
jgi:hypothetical protein